MKAVLYPRVSSMGQADGCSLDEQEKHCRAYCERMGFDVVAVERETYSGYDTLDERPALKRVRELIRRGEAQALVFWRVDRAGREIIDNLLLHREVYAAGGELHSACDGLIPNTPLGKTLLTLHSFAGEQEHDNILLRTRPAIRIRAENGRLLTNGRAKYGYVYNEQRDGYLADEETAPIVQKMYALAEQGHSIHDITRYLNDHHIAPPSAILARRGALPASRTAATHWGRVQVYRILQDPAYKGQQVAYRYKLHKYEKRSEDGRTTRHKVMKVRPETDSERIVQSVPALVTEEQWQAVQDAIAGRSLERQPEDEGEHTPLLTKGFVYCAHCGSRCGKESIKQRTGERTYVYRCNSLGNRNTAVNKCPYAFAIRTHTVDEGVWERVREIAKDTGRLEKLVRSRHERQQQQLAEAERRQANIADEIAECEQQQTLLVDRISREVDEGIAALYREKLTEVRHTLVGLRKKAQLTGHAHAWLTAFQTALQSLGTVVARGDSLDDLSRVDRRSLLRALNVRVVLYSRKSEFYRENGRQWDFTFDPAETADVGPVTLQSSSGPESRFW